MMFAIGYFGADCWLLVDVQFGVLLLVCFVSLLLLLMRGVWLLIALSFSWDDITRTGCPQAAALLLPDAIDWSSFLIYMMIHIDAQCTVVASVICTMYPQAVHIPRMNEQLYGWDVFTYYPSLGWLESDRFLQLLASPATRVLKHPDEVGDLHRDASGHLVCLGMHSGNLGYARWYCWWRKSDDPSQDGWNSNQH